jgi:hypothetical protein
MSKKTAPAIHFIDNDGNLHINGSKIRRHPEKPWLFSANDVRDSIKDRILKIGALRIAKADEREANNLPRGKAPKTPDAHFKEKAPSSYLKTAKLNHTLLSQYAKSIKKQAKDDLIGLCGSKRIRIRLLQLHGFEKASQMRAFILDLDITELCYTLQHGGRPETQGVWLCHQMLVDYASFLSAKFHAQVTQAFIEIASLNTEALEKRLNAVQIAKGTPERATHVQEHNLLVVECGNKHVNPAFPLNGIHTVMFGKSLEKVAKERKIKPPYNDGITVAELSVKTVAIGLTTMSMQRDVRKHIPNKEAKLIGMRAAATAVTLSSSPDAQRELDATVDKHMPAHIRARLSATANPKV